MATSISFAVSGLPPKKDGAFSMWNKPSERQHLFSLRKAAIEAMNGRPPYMGKIYLKIKIYSDVRSGDLDNFITGICDALMAAQKRTPINREYWEDFHDSVQPARAIVYGDDSQVSKIDAERIPVASEQSHYQVQIEFIE